MKEKKDDTLNGNRKQAFMPIFLILCIRENLEENFGRKYSTTGTRKKTTDRIRTNLLSFLNDDSLCTPAIDNLQLNSHLQ